MTSLKKPKKKNFFFRQFLLLDLIHIIFKTPISLVLKQRTLNEIKSPYISLKKHPL